MARWLRFANTLGALELLAADVCAAAEFILLRGAGACLARARARPHFAWRPVLTVARAGTAFYRRGNPAQRLDEFRMSAHNGDDPPRSEPVFTPTRATSLTTSLHVPGHTHLTTVGQELNRLAPSSCCRHRRPMGVRGRRAPTAQPSRVGKALPLFFGGTVARRLADRNPLTTTWSSSPDERLMVKLPISTCPFVNITREI